MAWKRHFQRLILSFLLIAIEGITKKPTCYSLRILGMKTTETPYYRLKMELHRNYTLSSVTRVLKEIPTPVLHILIVQRTNANTNNKRTNPQLLPQPQNQSPPPQGPKVLYNGTYKTCDFWKYVKRIRVFSNVAELVLSSKYSNLSLSCPLAVGTYVTRNIHVPPGTLFLKFMYFPNTIYTLYGTIYSQRSDKSLVKKCSYEINGTVFNSC